MTFSWVHTSNLECPQQSRIHKLLGQEMVPCTLVPPHSHSVEIIEWSILWDFGILNFTFYLQLHWKWRQLLVLSLPKQMKLSHQLRGTSKSATTRWADQLRSTRAAGILNWIRFVEVIETRSMLNSRAWDHTIGWNTPFSQFSVPVDLKLICRGLVNCSEILLNHLQLKMGTITWVYTTTNTTPIQNLRWSNILDPSLAAFKKISPEQLNKMRNF